MKHGQLSFFVLLASMAAIPMSGVMAQQDGNGSALLQNLSPVTDVLLQSPPDADWLIWRRTYDSLGYSPLEQINKQNVSNLTEAWRAPLQAGSNMATPLVHDGVLYLLSTNDTVLALDATSGTELWRYKHEFRGFPAARIGIALHEDKVLVPTTDLHVLALNAKTGALIWNNTINTTNTGPIPYSLRAAPLVAGGMVIQGVTATLMPEGGFIVGIDLQTGEEAWRFHTVARPDAPGGHTWNDLSLPQRSGGSVWVPGSYDPDLNLVYFGSAPTYDTGPLLPDLGRAGISNEALYTNATLALRPQTGELVWYYQHMPNDQWDLDWVYERQIVTLPVNGVDRKVVLTAGKMALYDALDAATGQYIFSVDMGLQNIVTGIDPVTGAKTLNPAAIPNAEDSNLLCPFANGGRNWPSAAVNPETRMLYVPMAEVCFDGGPTGSPGQLLSSGVAMVPQPLPGSDGNFGRLQAVNLATQELAWSHREIVTPASAVLATGGGLVFTGALNNSFRAFDDATGEVLWQADVGDIPASFPISYSVNGRQYIAVVVGQPSLHSNIFMGFLNGVLGPENSPVGSLQRSGAAVVVFALE
ncbi:MAG: PQQ-binding-like beta-propeller repeat protein [Pseudohongiellaceae bacterium]